MRVVTAYCPFCRGMCPHGVDGNHPPSLSCLGCNARQTLAPPS